MTFDMSHREKFNDFVHSSSSVMNADEIFDIIRIYCGPCPETKGAARQKFYRIKKRYLVKESYTENILYEAAGNAEKLLKVVPCDALFDLFDKVHTEGGKHLGRDRLFSVLKQQYCGFSKEVIQVYLNSCNECQLQKCKNS